MNQKVQNINALILRQCREQMAVSIEKASKIAARIEDIEAGEAMPTFKQLEKLAALYNVPEWVFLRDKLPDQYDYQNIPLFRQYSGNSGAFAKHKTRLVVSRVEQLRNQLIELCQDLDNEITQFDPPQFSNDNLAQTAAKVKQWLGLDNVPRDFKALREIVEKQYVFVFVTSKFQDWSTVGNNEFRGFASYHETMPIIVINGSEALEAQSFTLMHELGHLIFRKKSVFSVDAENELSDDEKFCDKLAGEILMPNEKFKEATVGFRENCAIEEIVEQLGNYAKLFKVSNLACATRMQQLRIISYAKYKGIRQFLKILHERKKQSLINQKAKIRRDIVREKLSQYGTFYCRTATQAYHEKQITLLKLCQQFGFKRVPDFFKMEKIL